MMVYMAPLLQYFHITFCNACLLFYTQKLQIRRNTQPHYGDKLVIVLTRSVSQACQN